MVLRNRISNWDLGRSHWGVRYGAAATFVLLALLLQFLPAARVIPFTFFYAAVALSARACGFGAAIFSMILTIAVVDFVLLEPWYSYVVGRNEALQMLLYGLEAMVIRNM